MEARQPLVSVIGAGSAPEDVLELARQVGDLLARQGYGVVTGGLGGVMAAACQGARRAGGFTLGILPGLDPEAANPHCQVVVPTGMGQARNLLVVLSGRGAIAISGGAGTLSEIGHALKHHRPVVSLRSWDLPGVITARSPQEAVGRLLRELA